MGYTTYHITLPLAGATGTIDSPRPYAGRVAGISIVYTGQTAPTLVIKSKGTLSQPPSLNLLTLAGSAVNGYYRPVQSVVKAADGTAIATWFAESVIDDFITVAVTAGGAAGSIDVWISIGDQS